MSPSSRIGKHLLSILQLLEKDKERNFAFKCHRENNDVFAVNCLCFHAPFGTFATCGSRIRS